MKRRSFLKKSALATSSLLVPGFLSSFDRYVDPTLSNKKLIVIQLSGGCDGLSAVIPYQNDIYFSARQRLAIKKSDALRLSDEMGLNPKMTGLKSLYDKGLLSIINNVGYPNANRSHFRSMDIWHSASNENEVWTSGWLGRYMDSTCETKYSGHRIIELDDSLSMAMKGEDNNGLALTNVNTLYQSIQSGRVKDLNRIAANKDYKQESLNYLYKTLASTASSIDYIKSKSKVYKSQLNYPNGSFGKRIKTIAELINSGSDTSVYYASLSGFDTHAAQKPKLDRLLGELSHACATLVQDLQQNNQMDDCAILIFSEFGRRLAENSSGGTDHGAGNTTYVISNQLHKPGLFNGATDLSNLDNGDIRFNIDFRTIYSSLLHKWLQVDDTKILKRAYKPLDLFT